MGLLGGSRQKNIIGNPVENILDFLIKLSNELKQSLTKIVLEHGDFSGSETAR